MYLLVFWRHKENHLILHKMKLSPVPIIMNTIIKDNEKDRLNFTILVSWSQQKIPFEIFAS